MAQIIRFPKARHVRCREERTDPQSAPLLQHPKGAVFQEAARRRLKAVIAHALAVLDQLEQEAS